MLWLLSYLCIECLRPLPLAYWLCYCRLICVVVTIWHFNASTQSLFLWGSMLSMLWWGLGNIMSTMLTISTNNLKLNFGQIEILLLLVIVVRKPLTIFYFSIARRMFVGLESVGKVFHVIWICYLGFRGINWGIKVIWLIICIILNWWAWSDDFFFSRELSKFSSLSMSSELTSFSSTR